jgi:hypothetical protein
VLAAASGDAAVVLLLLLLLLRLDISVLLAVLRLLL